MRIGDEIAPRIHEIGERIQGAKRPDKNHSGVAGWGQFLDAEGHKDQIGPYGTCAAVLFNQIANPDAAIAADVVAQLVRFWDDPAENRKLQTQNVRLAFLVLSLAGINDDEISRIRQSAIETLLQRQYPEGAWGDWVIGDQKGSPRQETTAWVLLALHRCNHNGKAVQLAQSYLLKRVSSARSGSTISEFAMAVLLATLDEGAAPTKLVTLAKSSLKKFDEEESERIQFFDYYEEAEGNNPVSPRRDYLCYPAVLPYALLAFGITKHAGNFGYFGAARARIALGKQIERMIQSGSYFVLPGAARASTVDQATIAVAYEYLSRCEKDFDGAVARVVPYVSRIRQNILIQIVLPLVLIVFALTALQDTQYIMFLIPDMTWLDREEIANSINQHEKLIRMVSSVVIFFTASFPARIWAYFRDRWFS
jgi:hypothetical protein